MNGTGVRRAELLVNTRSRRGADALQDLLAASRDVDLSYDHVHQLTDASQLTQTLQEIRDRRPPLLVVGSGDGTISDVVDFLTDTDIAVKVHSNAIKVRV